MLEGLFEPMHMVVGVALLIGAPVALYAFVRIIKKAVR
jgi:hypothetical protein